MMGASGFALCCSDTEICSSAGHSCARKRCLRGGGPTLAAAAAAAATECVCSTDVLAVTATGAEAVEEGMDAPEAADAGR